jgi:predicted transcriptional regulator
MSKFLLISIKEEFTEKIFTGKKSIELRKVRPSILSGAKVIIYCTSPIKAIVGIAEVKEVISHTPGEMWRLHSSRLGIDKKGFDEYYNNSEKAVGIVLTNPKRLDKTIDLESIKKVHPRFSPPQTYKYFAKFTQPSVRQDFQLTI